MAIVGSGNTGAQLVTVLRALGTEVALLEAQPRILPTADADVAAVLHRSFTDQGVEVVTGIGGVQAVAACATTTAAAAPSTSTR